MEVNSTKNSVNYLSHSLKRENVDNNAKNKAFSPAFKANFDSVLNRAGAAMNWIEKGGFLVLFLIQDFLGMTVPRTFAGFLRDKEVTGEYNIQEGFEVLGREGLTGPCMMAVAPLSLWITSKTLGHTTSMNTELIKRFGNSLKEYVSSSDFDRSVLKDADKFKNDFYRKNIENILNGVKKWDSKKEFDESVNYIMKQLANYENIPKDAKLEKFMGKSKYRTQCLDNITAHINDLRYNSSEDLNMLQKVKFGSEQLKDHKVFETNKTFEGLVKYSKDAITANKKLDKLDSVVAESLKHNALGKRILVNISMVAATLGVLSVLPKLYLRSNTAPGAKIKVQQNENIESQNVAFKGSSKNVVEKLGKAVEKNKNEFVSTELEYNGHNFTNTLMAGLSVFGLITPRCLRAYSRADVDDKGKKDLTELWEIIIRDLSSSLAVVFAVPMLTRACVTSYEHGSGYVLMQKDRSKKGFMNTFLDVINPYSKTHILSNAEISALYDNINSKEKMVNFCKYIDKNGGDLGKILSNAENKLFDEVAKKLAITKDGLRAKNNEKIIHYFENIEEHATKVGKPNDKKSVDEMITKLMKSAKKGVNSKITARARGLNSVPGLLTTLFISPYILGWFIPRLTYKNTRRIHENEERKRAQEENNQKLKIAV